MREVIYDDREKAYTPRRNNPRRYIKTFRNTQREYAKHLGVTLETLSRVINERSNLSPEMAVRIGEATGTSPESWYNMQVKLDLWKAIQKVPKNIGKFIAGKTA